jgi:hypothetical protein
MKKKIKIIDEICKRHPSYGVKKGWSEYTGGMKDSGCWYFRKMLDCSVNELQEFLDRIVANEKECEAQIGETLGGEKNMTRLPNGGWIYDAEKELRKKELKASVFFESSRIKY